MVVGSSPVAVISLIEILRSILENLFLNHAYLAAFLFGLKISAVLDMDFEFQYNYFLFKQDLSLELQVCNYHLNIGQDNC